MESGTENKKDNGVVNYFLTKKELEEVHKKYGEPGVIMYPEKMPYSFQKKLKEKRMKGNFPKDTR